MNYLEYVDALQNLLETPSTEIDFLKLMPRIIEYAELRIYRELDFLVTVQSSSANLTANALDQTVPTGVIILRSMNVTGPNNKTVPLLRVGTEFIDAFWPAGTPVPTPSVPQFYAMLTNTDVRVCPPPDSTYSANFVGTIRPAPMSSSNPTTFIGTNLPDLFIQASMVFASSYYQNYGAASEDPKMAMSWEQLYQTTFAGVNVETLRTKAASVSWTPYQPTPQANTARDRASAAA
jgi:hypothetical protein